MERETRKLKDCRDATVRKKRVLYESSKQLEKLEQTLDNQQAGERVSFALSSSHAWVVKLYHFIGDSL